MNARLASLSRDVTMVVRGLLGRTPSPLIARRPRAAPPLTTAPAPAAAAGSAPAPGMARPMVIERVERETADAVSLTLRCPDGAPVPFSPGQFFTLEVTIDGQRLRRAYSASSDARDRTRVTITVKRVVGGRVSTYLTEQVSPGTTVAVLGPSGDFVVAAATAPRHLVAVVGGSGITPVMAILRDVLVREPATRATLIYGNRDRASIIFADALATLATSHPGRLAIAHVLDDIDGPLTAARIADRLDAEVRDDAATLYLVCGPTPMMANAREVLTARGVDAARIREERFFTPTAAPTITAAQPVTIRRAGATTRVIVRPGDTLLEAGLAAGVPLKLSCAMGGCGACAVTLLDGAVTMDEPNCLSAGERARGTVLACVARPTAPCTVEAAP